MAFAHSPKIVTDGMVFYYDTGNSKSYIGEPTENLITHVLPNSSWVTNGAGTLITENYGLDPNGVLRSSKIVDNPNSGNGAFAYTSALNVSAGTYTFSAKVKTSSAAASANCYMVLYDMDPITNLGSTTFTNLTPGEWTNVAVTVTLASGTTKIAPHFMTPTGNVNDFIEVVDVQLEQKSHATPFVNGTRSATEALKDFTKNATLDLSNVSFDSNAQMEFDGTNDQFVLSDPGVGTSFSIEVLIKVDDYSNGIRFISPSSAGIDHFLQVNTNGTILAKFVEVADSASDNYVSTTVLSTGEYYHVVISKTPSNGTLYVNGVAEDSHTATLPAQAWSGDWRIGARWNSTFFLDGELPLMKVYNRALSAAEVQQNFNTIKGRFGI